MQAKRRNPWGSASTKAALLINWCCAGKPSHATQLAFTLHKSRRQSLPVWSRKAATPWPHFPPFTNSVWLHGGHITPAPAFPSTPQLGQGWPAGSQSVGAVVCSSSMFNGAHTHTHTALMPGLHGSSQAKLHPIPWFAPQAPAGCHSRSCRRRHYVSFAWFKW